jgi:hypothetical protein
MYPAYSPSQRSLAADDVAGLCFLYPSGGCEQAGCADGFECTASGCRQSCGKSVCEEGETCSPQGCVRPGACSGAECPPGPCKTDGACGLGQFCSAGRCVSGSGADGDPCTNFHECQGGACLDGSCTTACSEEVACPAQGTCVVKLGACQVALKALGDTCDSADDCRGQQCLQEDARPAMCTRRCGAGEPTCPDGWACNLVEDEHVCVAQHIAASGGGGCSLSAPALPSERPGGPRALLLAYLVGATLALAGRRSQNSRPILSAPKHGTAP